MWLELQLHLSLLFKPLLVSALAVPIAASNITDAITTTVATPVILRMTSTVVSLRIKTAALATSLPILHSSNFCGSPDGSNPHQGEMPYFTSRMIKVLRRKA